LACQVAEGDLQALLLLLLLLLTLLILPDP
jgi:hypothetical protein